MIADLMLRAVLAAALMGGAAACAAGVARQFAWQRRWIWAAALAGSLALPLMGPWVPAPGLVERGGLTRTADAVVLEHLSVMGTADGAGTRAPDPGATAAEGAGTRGELLETTLLLAWGAMSAALLAMLLWSGWRLRAARLTGARRRMSGVPVIVSKAIGPAVVGVLRPSVLLPPWVAELPPGERRLIAAHEWEHVRARDTALLAVAAAVLVLAPWNLALWWQHRRLRDAIETDCDARLLARGVDRHAYGLVLLHTAGRPSAFPLLSPSLTHTRSTLERRILAMTYRTPRHPVARSCGLLALAALGLAAACDFASNRPGTGPTEPVVPELSMGDDATAGPAAVAGDTYAVLESSEPGELLAIEGLGEEGDRTGFRVARSPAEAAGTEPVLLRARRVALTGEGEPLYIVDGVIVPTVDVDTLEIASVEVVKGAAAETIWGTRAANGVVNVTTATAAGGSPQRTETLRLAPTRVRGQAARPRQLATPAGAEPVYLVDGLRVDALDMEALEVHSIEVVKGAAAREILGQESPGGVVRITTKAAARAAGVDTMTRRTRRPGG